MHPYSLTTDRQRTPRGIVAPPHFSWKLAGDGANEVQTAYRITVEGALGVGASDSIIVWDSGWVDGDSTLDIPYEGRPLVSSTNYRWTVRVRDARGEDSVAASTFSTALLHHDEWQGVWIGRNPIYVADAPVPQDTDISYTVNKLKPVRRFVKHFPLQTTPESAFLHVAAKGAYRVYINGVRVGKAELCPGWTDYRYHLPYQSYDVTDYLVEGENALAFLLADGWWSGFIGTDRRHHAQHYGEEPEILTQLNIGLPGGRHLSVVTDEDWKESASEIVYADMLMGQYEDGRNRDDHWHLPGTDISAWSSVVVTGEGAEYLVPDTDDPVVATEVVPPVSISRVGDKFIVDFGQNLVGRCRITLRDQAEGRRVSLNHAEMLKEDGTLYTENLRTVEAVDVYWTGGERVEEFEPRFTLHGFRYVEISGLQGEPRFDDIEAIVLHNGFEMVGEVRTSDPKVNQLISNIRWGMRGNMVSIPTDCPQRDERLGWTADAQVFAPTACYMADLLPFFRRWMRDVRAAQSDEGAFPDTAPHMVHVREGAPAWGDAGTTIPWLLYRMYGSTQVLKESVDSMIAWVEYIRRFNPSLIWRDRLGNNYGDWLQIGEETPKDVLSTAYFAHSTSITAETLRVLGRDEEAASYADLADQIRRAFVREFVDDDGRIHGDTQTCYLLALTFGLLPKALVPAAERHLAETVERRGVSLTTGFVGVSMLCQTLTRIGRSDLAFGLLHNERFPSWLYSVNNGATTIWERWDGWTEEHGFQSARMNSFNHYSLGSVGEWIYRYLAGIDQAEGSLAFKRIVLHPQFDPTLDYVEARYDSARGLIRSSWIRDGAGIRLEIEIPPNTSAELVLGEYAIERIEQEGDRICSPAESIALESEPNSERRCVMGSGQYQFHITK